MKWPFVSRAKFGKLEAENSLLRLEKEDLIDRINADHDDHERELRRLRDELHHARQAIFNTKQMKQYEEMMLQRAVLDRPHPAETMMHLMAMTDAAKADIRKATGIDDLDLGRAHTARISENAGETQSEPDTTTAQESGSDTL